MLALLFLRRFGPAAAEGVPSLPFPSLPLRPSLSRSSWQEGALLLTPLLTPGKGERARVYVVREKRDGRGALSEEKKCLFASCEFGEIDVGGRGLECSVLL